MEGMKDRDRDRDRKGDRDKNRDRKGDRVVSWIADVFNNLWDSLFSAKIELLMEGSYTSK